MFLGWSNLISYAHLSLAFALIAARNGKTALWIASSHDMLETVRLLVNAGASLAIPDKAGTTQLSRQLELSATVLLQRFSVL